MKFALILVTLVTQYHAIGSGKCYRFGRLVQCSTTQTTTSTSNTRAPTATKTTRAPTLDNMVPLPTNIITPTLAPVNIEGWLASGYNDSGTKATVQNYTYLNPTTTGNVKIDGTFCPQLLSAPSSANLTSQACFDALSKYLGNNGNRSVGNATERLNNAMTALSEAVNVSVKDTGTMKDKLDHIVKAVLFNNRTDSRDKNQKKIINQELQLRNMISLIRTSLDSLSASNAFGEFNESLALNMADFELNAIDKFITVNESRVDERLVDNISATVMTLWSDLETNLPRLLQQSELDQGYIDGNIRNESIHFSNAVGPLKTELTSFNVTEAGTMSGLEQQVANFTSNSMPLTSGLDTLMNERISDLGNTERGKLDLILDGILSDFLTEVNNSRNTETFPVLPSIQQYDDDFSVALRKKNFGNLVDDLSSKITKLISEADVVMQALISRIHARVSQVRMEIFPLRDSDQHQALKMANQVSSFLPELNSANQELTATSKELLGQIEKTKTDLVSLVQSERSGKLDYLFKNIVSALTQIAEVKKAALENIKAKLAAMDATIAKLLALSGLSAEEFYRKIDDTARKMKLIQDDMRDASFDAKALSTEQTRDVTRSVTNLMSLQAARLALNSTALQAGREAATNMVKVANVKMVNDAGTRATDVFQSLASANLQEYRANLDFKMNVTKSALALEPDFKVAVNDFRLLDSEIKSVVDGVATLDADQLAGSHAISDYLTEFADVMERLIEFFHSTTVEEGRTDLEKVHADQNNKVSDSGESQTNSIAKMSALLFDTEDPFIKAVSDVKVPDLQEPIETISQVVAGAWSDFKSDAIDLKIVSLNDATTTDMAAAESDQAQASGAKTADISDSLTSFKRRLLVAEPLDKVAVDMLDFSGKLANISHQTAVLSTSGDRLMSDFSDYTESEIAKFIAFSTNISDFLWTVGPDFSAQNNSAYARKATLDSNASDLMNEAGGVFTEARQEFQTRLETILKKASNDSESIKAALDPTPRRAAIPTMTSMLDLREEKHRLDKLIDDLLVYSRSLPKLTGTVEDENTELMMINIFAPLIEYIAFANNSFLTQERATADKRDVPLTISWTGAVANSIWGAGQLATDLSNSKLMRSSAESALNSQVTKLQLARLHGFLDGQVVETEATVNASAIATEDATKGVGSALTEAGSDIAGSRFEMAGTFANAAGNLSLSEQDISNSIASADSSVASLSSGFNSLIAGSLTEIMAKFTGMAEQLSQDLPIDASAAVDVEKGRLVSSFNQVTQNITSSSDKISAYFQSANTSLRKIQVSTKRFEAIGAAISAMKNDIVELENAAIAQANKAADDAVAAEKVRISDEMAAFTADLVELKKTATEHIAQLSV